MKPLVEIRSGLGIDFERRLLGFSFESNDRSKSKAILKLDNRDLELVNWYPPNATAAVRWGYPGNLTPWRVIQFKRIRGFRELQFEANGLEAVLDRTERTEAYSGTRSQIVQEIASKRYGFSGRLLHVEDTIESVGTINQLGETDAVFIKRLAAEEGFVFYVDDTGLHWHAPKYDEAPIRVFTFNGADETNTIISEPQLDFDLLRHFKRVKKKKLDTSNKNVEEDEVDETTDTEAKELGAKTSADNLWENVWTVQSTGEPVLEKRFNSERAIALIDQRAKETEDPKLAAFVQSAQVLKTMNPTLLNSMLESSLFLMAHGDPKKKKRALAATNIKFSFNVIGDPSLMAGQVVRCLGLSDILDGNFYLKKVVHTIENGYECALSIQKHNPEKNPRKGKLENTGASVNKETQTGEAKPKFSIDEKGRVYEYPPGFIGPI